MRHVYRRDRSRRIYPRISTFSTDLLNQVWGLAPGADVYEIYPFLHLYERIRIDIKGKAKIEITIEDVKRTLDAIKTSHTGHVPGAQQKISQRLEHVEEAVRNVTGDLLARAAGGYNESDLIRSVIQLWLFVPIDVSSKDATFEQLIAKAVPGRGSPLSPFVVETPRLSWDFSEKSITRKGGFQLEFTSDLSEHLTLVGTSRIRIFQHISALEKYADGSEEALFPELFVRETMRTIQLLFRPTGVKTSIRTRRIASRRHVDIELAIANCRNEEFILDLTKYPYWGERLAKIQQRLDRNRPSTLKQWWFDRRNRFEWATFWTAIVVFILTLLFGLISSITGILQVVATF